jgi:acetyl esterase/lipase
VVVWVHGGAYRVGDKRNAVADKVRVFNARGWVFVSVNYRLTKRADPASARYPDHFRDVAAAVAWTRAHASRFGGDARRLALLGHSAGADIVSNVTTNPRWLRERGLPLRAVRCAGPLDTAGFDKTRVPDGTDQSAQWRIALGNAPNYKAITSATLLARPRTGVPPTITVVRGVPLRRSIETAFAAAIRRAGAPATVIDAQALTHEQVNRRIGAPGDTVMTPPLVRFLRGCFARR